MVQVALEQLRGLLGPVARRDFDAGLLEQPVAGAGDVWVGVGDGVADGGDSCRDQRVGAGRGAAVVGARFEGDVDGRAARAVASVGERLDLGVVAPGRLRAPRADDLTVAHDDRADRGVRRGPAEGVPRLGERGGHEVRCGHVASPRWRG